MLEQFLALLAAGADRTTDPRVAEEMNLARLQARAPANDRAVVFGTSDPEAG